MESNFSQINPAEIQGKRHSHLRAIRDGRITVALLGNPNSGKTTIFNHLTGSKQHVGNYPGVTVEKKSGKCNFGGHEITFVDLPGTYSLTADSVEELISRQFILQEKPDLVVNIVDASNLERNLYLSLQILELGVPLVVVLNMSDLAQKQGLDLDIEKLSTLLGVPVVATVGHKKVGLSQLLHNVVSFVQTSAPTPTSMVSYGSVIEEELTSIQGEMKKYEIKVNEADARWIALKLLENDEEVLKQFVSSPSFLQKVKERAGRIEKLMEDHPEVVIADRRYGYISGICHKVVRRDAETRRNFSDILDSILIHRVVGLPIFVGMMWLVFTLTFKLSEAPMNLLETGFGKLSALVTDLLPSGVLQSLMVDGIIGGIGGILSFVPMIMFLFLAIAILEDSGYMARAAFITDRFMSKIGLHGKSFIPMLLGFGCGVPALMATRTLSSRKDRLTTMLVIPLMSCGARLPIYTLIIATFFRKEIGGYVLSGIYLFGVLAAIVMAKLLQRFLFRGPPSPFVMELPPYRFPTLKSVMLHMWEKTRMYLKRAATILLAAAILIWALCNFPTGGDNLSATEKLEQSFAGRIGHALVTPLEPIGLGNWKVGVALFSGFAAKEVFVSTLGVLYSLGDEATEESEPLRAALHADAFYTPLRIVSLLIFVLLYLPCISLLVVMGKETRSLRWPLFAATYLTSLAWVASFFVYQGGVLFGLGP
ncbi:MAG TPA: ferrous iron transport protein B [Bdellovibrionota bacterium]|nr:ferrous iron transport protein B [Bdellovibrionota bacterium]